MAAKVKTRKADEKQRTIVLVGQCSHQIVGTKLPSNKQILEVFFYNMRFVNLTAKESAKLTINAVIIFWQQARIPIKNTDKCIEKLLQLYEDWQFLQKRPKVEEMSNTMKEKYNTFTNNLNNLFDIAHADALSMIRIDEDRKFLEMQRKDERPGSMLGLDQTLSAKEERSRLRKEEEEARKMRHLQTQRSASTMQENGEYLDYLGIF